MTARELELTEAVEAASAAYFTARYPDLGAWDDLSAVMRHNVRELVLPVVRAAAPFIAAQVEAGAS